MENTTVVNDYLIANGRPQPPFDSDGPRDLVLENNKEVEDARMGWLCWSGDEVEGSI